MKHPCNSNSLLDKSIVEHFDIEWVPIGYENIHRHCSVQSKDYQWFLGTPVYVARKQLWFTQKLWGDFTLSNFFIHFLVLAFCVVPVILCLFGSARVHQVLEGHLEIIQFVWDYVTFKVKVFDANPFLWGNISCLKIVSSLKPTVLTSYQLLFEAWS